MLITLLIPTGGYTEGPSDRENWEVIPKYETFGVRTIAVLPMDNMSLEPDVEKHLYNAIYNRLNSKGYSRISRDHVEQVMAKLGVKTSGQLAGISLKKLAKFLHADAVLKGQIEQSAVVHSGVYDAVVVSSSLSLVHCESGKTLWRVEQWRTAHRQWQVDPINMLISIVSHELTSREKQVNWLAEQMLKTLPDGPIMIEKDNLFDKALELSPSK